MLFVVGVKSFELDFECVLCLVFGYLGIEDFILEVVSYGFGCFWSYEGIFIILKKGNEKRMGEVLCKECGWIFL